MAKSNANTQRMRRKPRQARSQERVNQILDVAEHLFIEDGVDKTSTNAIAKQANVPIGSLYQFFPDKQAILYALAERYMQKVHQQLTTSNAEEVQQLPLAEYVDHIVDSTYRLFEQNPGYHAIFIQVQNTMPELADLEETADAQIIQDWAIELAQRNPCLQPKDCETMAFVLTKSIGLLLWLSLSQDAEFRQRIVAETKKLMLGYLNLYF